MTSTMITMTTIVPTPMNIGSLFLMAGVSLSPLYCPGQSSSNQLLPYLQDLHNPPVCLSFRRPQAALALPTEG